MLYGITDIGSNTIRFKVYQYKNNKIKPLISKKKTAGLISYRENGKLNDEGIEVLLSTLKKFKKYMHSLDVEKTCYFATASLRNIENSEEVKEIIKSNLNIDIIILSSEKEAELSFKSVAHDDLDKNEGVLIDVGGGSSEITIFENKNIIAETSLPIGSLYCYDKYVSLMLPTPEENEEIRERVKLELEKSGIKQYTKDYLYGVGGTVRTIKKLLEHLDIKKDKSNTIPINLLNSLLNELKENNKECYRKILRIKPDRIHTIVPGIVIVKTIAEFFNIKYLHISQDSLREGVLYALINGDIR